MLGYLLIDGSEQNTELVHNLLVQFTGVSATSSETFREELKAMAALCIHRGREKSNTAIRIFFFCITSCVTITVKTAVKIFCFHIHFQVMNFTEVIALRNKF